MRRKRWISKMEEKSHREGSKQKTEKLMQKKKKVDGEIVKKDEGEDSVEREKNTKDGYMKKEKGCSGEEREDGKGEEG